MRRSSTIAGFITLLEVGLLSGSLGPTITHIRGEYRLSNGTAGLLVGFVILGSLAGIALLRLATGLSSRKKMLSATGAIPCGALIVSASHSWPLTLAGAFVIGLGFGSAGAIYNTLFASEFGKRGSAMITMLNGTFNIGSVLGPILIGFVHGAGYRAPYILGAVIGTVALFIVTSSSQTQRTDAVVAPSSPKTITAPKRRLLILFVILLCLYGASESTMGSWANTYLLGLKHDAHAAALGTTLFWLGMMSGRFASAPICLRFAEERIVTVALTLVLPVMWLVSIPQLSTYACFIAGILMAPVFPCLMSWAVAGARDVERVGLWTYAAAMLGSGLGPVAVGFLIDSTNPAIMPLAVGICASACLAGAIAMSTIKRTRPHALPIALPGPLPG